MGYMEWTKVIVEVIVDEGIIDAEEDCSFLCSWSFWEECQIKPVYNQRSVSQDMAKSVEGAYLVCILLALRL